jgi:ornithine--oxo-acid transaminase
LNTAARPFCEELKQRGVLCKETHASVIRLAPPLIIDKADLDWGLTQIRAVLERELAAAIEHRMHVDQAVVSL